MKRRRNRFDLYFGPTNEARIAIFHINRRRHNLFFTSTDLRGAVLSSVSSKIFVVDRKKRFAAHVVELMAKRVITFIRAYRVENIKIIMHVRIKRFLFNAVSRTLRSSNLKFIDATDLIPVAHNGCRQKKVRRL